ncbi:hypothetical protein RF55_16696, partial [Lasius niger]
MSMDADALLRSDVRPRLHKKDFFGLVKESFLTQRGTLLDLALSLKNSVEQTEPVEAGALQPRRTLPRIQLPSFSGKYEEWPAFRDLFRSLITQDPSVSGVERLHYLRTSVKGEAEQLIRNLPTTGDNFDRAWSMLADHYENKRLLVRSCFSTFTAIPRMKNESAADLKHIFHGMLSTVGTLEGIGRPISDCTDLLVHLVVEMLDPRSRREWETSVSDTSEPPSYAALKTFLERRMRTLEALQPAKTEPPSSSSSKAANTASRSAISHLAQKTAKKSGRCAMYQGDHYILFCGDFQKKQPKEEFAEAKQLCLNCFGKHQLTECQSKKNCAACNARHHSSTHNAYAPPGNPSIAASTLHVQRRTDDRATVLLATARVDIADRWGTRFSVCALIDSGSEVSLITEALAQLLRLSRSAASVTILGIGGQRAVSANGRVKVHLSSRTTDFTMHLTALVLPRISAYGVRVKTAGGEWPHVRDLPLADPDFQAADPVELLLGADAFFQIIEDGLRKGGPRAPIAQRTTLGWILSGVVDGVKDGAPALAHQCTVDENLSALVSRFWEQEELPHTPLPLTEDEQRCEDLFVDTHTRTP